MRDRRRGRGLQADAGADALDAALLGDGAGVAAALGLASPEPGVVEVLDGDDGAPDLLRLSVR